MNLSYRKVVSSNMFHLEAQIAYEVDFGMYCDFLAKS